MNFLEARKNMVDGQLRPNRIKNQTVLQAFADTPREKFLPPNLQEIAYADTPHILSDGRVVLPPLVQARMLQSLDIQAGHRVLVVGGLEGYMPVLLLKLDAILTVVEPDAHHATIGQNNMADMNGHCEKWLVQNAEEMIAENAFDHIILNLPTVDVPHSLFHQLKNGGQLVAVVTENTVPTLMHYTKNGKTVLADALAETHTVPVAKAFTPEESFVF